MNSNNLRNRWYVCWSRNLQAFMELEVSLLVFLAPVFGT